MHTLGLRDFVFTAHHHISLKVFTLKLLFFLHKNCAIKLNLISTDNIFHEYYARDTHIHYMKHLPRVCDQCSH